jgi:hypothetical protein
MNELIRRRGRLLPPPEQRGLKKAPAPDLGAGLIVSPTGGEAMPPVGQYFSRMIRRQMSPLLTPKRRESLSPRCSLQISDFCGDRQGGQKVAFLPLTRTLLVRGAAIWSAKATPPSWHYLAREPKETASAPSFEGLGITPPRSSCKVLVVYSLLLCAALAIAMLVP